MLPACSVPAASLQKSSTADARSAKSWLSRWPISSTSRPTCSSNAKEVVMDYSKIITIEPDKRSGKPCIRGLRMTVTDVLEYLAGGMSQEELLAEFPDLTSDDIRACLAFAA